MLTNFQWVVKQLGRQLWARATLFAAIGVAAALVALAAETFLPPDLPVEIGADAVDGILHILASSMLAVTTFSLSVMVAAYSAATSNVTPRATQLLMQDSTTQNALAAFIGSFLFSLVGLVALSTGAYGERGRVVLFVATIAVIAVIVATLLRWIDHLSRLGRVGETSDRVERATRAALDARKTRPSLGGRALMDPAVDIPAAATPVRADATGYVMHVDAQRLSAIADETDTDIFLEAVPGKFVHPESSLVRAAFGSGENDEELRSRIQQSFDIGAERSFDEDPRFGLIVLAEIASRALSPAVNDSGTAIDVIGRQARLLIEWASPLEDAAPAVVFPRLWVPPLRADDLFADAFGPVARDGARSFETAVRLQKALAALQLYGDTAFRSAAASLAEDALGRAESALKVEAERAMVRSVTQSRPAS